MAGAVHVALAHAQAGVNGSSFLPGPLQSALSLSGAKAGGQSPFSGQTFQIKGLNFRGCTQQLALGKWHVQ
jgi:hypothetical protein